MSIVLIVLYVLIRQTLGLMQQVTAEAEKAASQPLRYTQGLRPEDLIHIGEFIKAWVPPKH